MKAIKDGIIGYFEAHNVPRMNRATIAAMLLLDASQGAVPDGSDEDVQIAAMEWLSLVASVSHIEATMCISTTEPPKPGQEEV